MEKTLRRGTAAISTASPSLRSPFILAIPIPLADNASPTGTHLYARGQGA
ncbi:MAG: hypothetical protein IJW11_04605 [Clostridia bacterium]|nr:hypothetical protein [Clostridia bacterium]